MAVGIKSNADGLSGALTVNGVDVVQFDATGITQGVPPPPPGVDDSTTSTLTSWSSAKTQEEIVNNAIALSIVFGN